MNVLVRASLNRIDVESRSMGFSVNRELVMASCQFVTVTEDKSTLQIVDIIQGNEKRFQVTVNLFRIILIVFVRYEP